MAVDGPSGQQAIAFNVLPDFKPVKVDFKSSKIGKTLCFTGIDFDPKNRYETMNSPEDEESKDCVMQADEEIIVPPKLNEYIFLIDRSGSM